MLRQLGCWLASLDCAVALLGLAGCSAPTDGLTGISVDDAGHWVVVLAWSCHSPDVVDVWHVDDSNTVNPDIIDARIDAPTDKAAGKAGPATGKVTTMTVDMFQPPADWTVRTAAQPLDPSVTYHAASGTRDSSWSTAAVDFRLEDIDGLEPGQVLYWGDYDKNVVTPMEEFEKAATRSC